MFDGVCLCACVTCRARSHFSTGILSFRFPSSQVHSPEGQILWTAPFNVGHAAPVPPTAVYGRESHCYMTLLDDGSLTLYGTTNNKKVTKNFPIMWTSDTCKV